MSSVELRHVHKSFARGIVAVDDVNLRIDEGEFVVLLGPSGCGKTTTLRMMAGFDRPTSGQILFSDKDVTDTPARQREIGMVFQNYALFPNMTVAENIAFGLKQRKMSADTLASRVEEMLVLAQLVDRRDQFPSELSGGQQQRVALVRAIAISPRLLLMDEPLGALDLKLREAMQIELKQIQRQLGITTILVTHDQQEAMSLADRVVVMHEGRVCQVGSPEELYDRPKSQFVGEFVGKNNVLGGVVTEADSEFFTFYAGSDGSEQGAIVALQNTGDALKSGDTALVGLRPELLSLKKRGSKLSGNNCPGTIIERKFMGNCVHYFVELSWKQIVVVESPTRHANIKIGSDVIVHFKPEHCRALSGADRLDA